MGSLSSGRLSVVQAYLKSPDCFSRRVLKKKNTNPIYLIIGPLKMPYKLLWMSEKASTFLCVDVKWHCKVYNSLYQTPLTLLIDTEIPLHEKKSYKCIPSGEAFIWNNFFVYGYLCTVESRPLKEVGLYEDRQLTSHCNRRPVLEFHTDPTSRDC